MCKVSTNSTEPNLRYQIKCDFFCQFATFEKTTKNSEKDEKTAISMKELICLSDKSSAENIIL